MSEDRREERALEPDGGWLDRLMHRFNLRHRENVRDDLEEVLAEASEQADLSPYERTLLGNVLAVHRVRVGDVMVPRGDIVAAAADLTIGEALGLFRTIGHSRLPVYRDTLDEPLGMVHIRDLVNHVTGQGEIVRDDPADPPRVAGLASVDLAAPLGDAGLLRPVLFVPGSMPAIDLLARMQASRTHIALVIDEYGGTDGLVSMEDLVETVVGDIEDEHDQSRDVIVRDEAGHFLVDARAELGEVAAALGLPLDAGPDAAGVDTLGGLVVTKAGRVPLRGETFEGPDGLVFEVVEADRRRLKRILIRMPDGDPAASAPPGPPPRPGA